MSSIIMMSKSPRAPKCSETIVLWERSSSPWGARSLLASACPRACQARAYGARVARYLQRPLYKQSDSSVRVIAG